MRVLVLQESLRSSSVQLAGNLLALIQQLLFLRAQLVVLLLALMALWKARVFVLQVFCLLDPLLFGLGKCSICCQSGYFPPQCSIAGAGRLLRFDSVPAVKTFPLAALYFQFFWAENSHSSLGKFLR